MRALLPATLLLSLLVALPTAVAEPYVPDGECGRGPYETVLPADVFCCADGYLIFCLRECDVWVRLPVLGGYACINPT